MLRQYRGVTPRVHESAYVDDSAQVIGDVEIGAESSVWMNVVMRGDVHRIRVGARTNVQDGTVIHVSLNTHPTVIGADVTIGHGARLHGCTLEDGCMVGIGAVVLDGAVVEPGAIVAAGAVLAPGKRVPSGEMWAGCPARKARDLKDSEREFLRINSKHYCGLARAYLAG